MAIRDPRRIHRESTPAQTSRKKYKGVFKRKKRHPILAMREFFRERRESPKVYSNSLREMFSGEKLDAGLKSMKSDRMNFLRPDEKASELAEYQRYDRIQGKHVVRARRNAINSFMGTFNLLVDYWVITEAEHLSRHPELGKKIEEEQGQRAKALLEESNPAAELDARKIANRIKKSKLKRHPLLTKQTLDLITGEATILFVEKQRDSPSIGKKDKVDWNAYSMNMRLHFAPEIISRIKKLRTETQS